MIVAPERDRRGLYERRQIATAHIRIHAVADSLSLPFQLRLDTHTVHLAGVCLVVQTEEALRDGVMDLHHAARVGHEYCAGGHARAALS